MEKSGNTPVRSYPEQTLNPPQLAPLKMQDQRLLMWLHAPVEGGVCRAAWASTVSPLIRKTGAWGPERELKLIFIIVGLHSMQACKWIKKNESAASNILCA